MKRGRIILFAWLLPGLLWGIAAQQAPAATVAICQIQGTGLTSPYAGKSVQTQGVVTADFDETGHKGFFLQAANCDINPASSDGIFVYLGEAVQVVSLGDSVQVTGVVQEYYGMTEISTSSQVVELLAQNQPLPAPEELNPPFDNALAKAYLEAREGMLAGMGAARVVGPTSSRAETWLVRADLGVMRVFQDDLVGTGEIVCVDAEGLYQITPEARVGDQVMGLQGVLAYSFGQYVLHLLTAPTLNPVSDVRSGTEIDLESGFRFGSLNLENLFDTLDDPARDDTVLTATEYQRKLEKLALAIHALGEPAFLAVQEAENGAVLGHLVNHPTLEAEYGVAWLDGPDRRGLDVALLFRTDVVAVLDFQQYQGCTSLVDGLGPDGNLDMLHPANAQTCDTNSDGVLDGNRLFSRPPLLLHLQVALEGGGEDLWVLANHWKSKTEDSEAIAYTLPRRLEQARFTAALAQSILGADPQAALIVLGDLNDFPSSQPLAILAEAGLLNLMPRVARDQRYSYIYQGISQVLDHVLISPVLQRQGLWPAIVHLNADFPEIVSGQSGTATRSSDHDPVVVEFSLVSGLIFLPLLGR